MNGWMREILESMERTERMTQALLDSLPKLFQKRALISEHEVAHGVAAWIQGARCKHLRASFIEGGCGHNGNFDDEGEILMRLAGFAWERFHREEMLPDFYGSQPDFVRAIELLRKNKELLRFPEKDGTSRVMAEDEAICYWIIRAWLMLRDHKEFIEHAGRRLAKSKTLTQRQFSAMLREYRKRLDREVALEA